ncbi:MAG: transposase, partial [Saprospiraceae bacterium]|nr:transposase [Saprospiraceae bacterium]
DAAGMNPLEDLSNLGGKPMWSILLTFETSKQGVVKTDKIDARNIARQLRAGNLRPLIIPSVDRDCFRTLTRRRNSIGAQGKKNKTSDKKYAPLSWHPHS